MTDPYRPTVSHARVKASPSPQQSREVETELEPAKAASASSEGVDRTEPPHGSVRELLDWVGDDRDRARAALDAETGPDGLNRKSAIRELEDRVSA